MFKKRFILATFSVVVLLSVAFSGFMLLAESPRSGITKANFERVQNGMSQQEVELIFGQPPNGPCIQYGRSASLRWISDDRATAAIAFSVLDDKVFDKTWSESNESIAERVGRWLHWPWW